MKMQKLIFFFMSCWTCFSISPFGPIWWDPGSSPGWQFRFLV